MSTEHKIKSFKIIFEDMETGKQAFFFINGLNQILEQEYFNIPIKDAKKEKEFTIRQSIENQLK
jgi:hypothetical protein